jgi:hypothetical protein
MDPALRQEIPHGTGDGLKPLSVADGREVHDVVKEEVPLVERLVGAGELHRATAVLPDERGEVARSRRFGGDWLVLSLCFHGYLLSRNRQYDFVIFGAPHLLSLRLCDEDPFYFSRVAARSTTSRAARAGRRERPLRPPHSGTYR